MKSLSDQHGKQNGRLIDGRRSTRGNRFATDDRAANKEIVGLIYCPPGRPPPYVSTHRAAQRASGSSDRSGQVTGRSNAGLRELCDRARASVACTIGDSRDSHRMTTSKSFERSGVLPATNLIRQAFRDCPGISQSSAVSPRSTNPIAMPAPIPCNAPVTMAVFGGPLKVVHLEDVLLPEKDRCSSGSEIRCR